MTIDADRIRSKLNDIGKALKRLRAFQPLSRKEFLQSEDNQDIARSRLLTGIEAALNVCYQLSAKKLNNRRNLPGPGLTFWRKVGNKH